MIRRQDFIHAMGMPDEGFERAVDAALRQVKEREARPVMKRKMTCTLLAAVVTVVALAGAALAVGLNLFDYFGQYDERLQAMAPQSMLADNPAVEVSTDALGVTKAQVDSAYYDGESLIIAYCVDNFRGCARYEPTAAELAEMTAAPDFQPDALDAAADPQGILEAFQAAVDQNKPFGIAMYEIAVGDPCTAGDGVALIPRDADVESAEDGPLYCVFEFETPLPEAARGRDSLTVRLPVTLHTSRYWFDGEKVCEGHSKQTLAELSATVPRANAG